MMPVSLQRIISLPFLAFLAIILSVPVMAQPLKSAESDAEALTRYIQMKYGLDQELFNGYQYYTRFLKYKGDPFFPEDSFYEGSVCIGGVEYDQVSLKFNSYSQYLILEFTDFKDRYNQLRLNNIHIDSFRLGTHRFQRLSIQGEEAQFYQILSSGSVTCYIHWAKDIHATSDDLQYSHEYTRPLGTYYISYRGEIHAFNNRNSFLSIFPESLHSDIKKYIRQQRISFKEAGPVDIQKLLIHISQLEETHSEI